MSDTPQGAVPIGSKLYFFKSDTNSTDCLISAHGGYYKGNNTFEVADGVELLFYGIHGNLLQDPGIRLVDTPAKPVQVIPNRVDGRNCINYVLSKYQGRHGGKPGKPAETYDKISNRVRDNDKNQFGRFDLMLKKQDNEKLVEKLMQQILAHRAMSVVTIRNRWFLPGGDVYLKEVIKEVRKAFPGIKRFHCSFCRGLVGDETAGTSVVEMV